VTHGPDAFPRSAVLDFVVMNIHRCRSEAAETEGRRGFSEVRATQAYSLRYVEEAEQEKTIDPSHSRSNGFPARGSGAAVGIYGCS
jgi:hypothetical protein